MKKITMKKSISLLGTLTMLLASSVFITNNVYASSPKVELSWETEGFQRPESVLYDDDHNILFVSNINGTPLDKDGNGFISVVGKNGTIKNLKWVTGLNAPKGLSRVKDKLYVSDIDQLVEIGINNGRILNRYSIADAKFMNDVSTDTEGNVYVSDMLANRIYRLKDGKLTVWFESDEIPSPNGLHVEKNRIIVGSWGKMTDGFKTDVPGHLMTVSLSDKSVNSLGSGEAVGNLDGVEAAGDSKYYVTDWLSGGLFLIDSNGSAEKLLPLQQGSADHEVITQKNLIIIPMMLNDKIVAYSIK